MEGSGTDCGEKVETEDKEKRDKRGGTLFSIFFLESMFLAKSLHFMDLAFSSKETKHNPSEYCS